MVIEFSKSETKPLVWKRVGVGIDRYFGKEGSHGKSNTDSPNSPMEKKPFNPSGGTLYDASSTTAQNGRPGVYSARYAGDECSFEDNINKVLSEMQNMDNRKACFMTVIALILNEKEYLFEGKVDGIILREKQGKNGFGYDPVFQPFGHAISFAEMDLDTIGKQQVKNL